MDAIQINGKHHQKGKQNPPKEMNFIHQKEQRHNSKKRKQIPPEKKDPSWTPKKIDKVE
jgi:hypothetical protein